MSDTDVMTIHVDGAARGNPGPAAYAYVISRDGEPDVEVKETLGKATNNVAEYTALVQALEHASILGGKRLHVFSDSDLLVQQMNGRYRVKHPGLKPLYEQARELTRRFDTVSISHIPREKNSRADRLCNIALDSDSPRTRAKPKTAPSARIDSVREEAVQCLRAMAAAWARGNPHEPKPEDVWDQLWSILDEGGVIRATK